MSIPGFTAEISLFKISDRYNIKTAWVGAGGQTVVPQAPIGFPSLPYKCIYGPCLPILNCVDPLGCKVVGYRRQRCCYFGPFPLGCSWVAC